MVSFSFPAITSKLWRSLLSRKPLFKQISGRFPLSSPWHCVCGADWVCAIIRNYHSIHCLFPVRKRFDFSVRVDEIPCSPLALPPRCAAFRMISTALTRVSTGRVKHPGPTEIKCTFYPAAMSACNGSFCTMQASR